MVVFKGVGRVIRRAYYLYIIAFHQTSGREVRLFQLLVTLIENLAGGTGIQQLVDTKSGTEFEVRPVIEWVTHAVGHRLGPLLELLPVAGIARDVFLIYAVATHGPPLVMVTTQPQLCDRAETVVFCYLLRVQVTVIIYDGKMLCLLVKQLLRRLGLQQEVFVHESFHIDSFL